MAKRQPEEVFKFSRGTYVFPGHLDVVWDNGKGSNFSAEGWAAKAGLELLQLDTASEHMDSNQCATIHLLNFDLSLDSCLKECKTHKTKLKYLFHMIYDVAIELGRVPFADLVQDYVSFDPMNKCYGTIRVRPEVGRAMRAAVESVKTPKRVILKSGGPVMLVKGIEYISDKTSYRCEWDGEEHKEEAVFDAQTLNELVAIS